MRLGLVFGVIGYLLRLFAVVFVPPFLLAVWDAIARGASPWHAIAFLVAGAFTGVGGWLFSRAFQRTPVLRRGEALGVVAGTWFVVAVCGSVPYLFYGLAVIDAFFESLSGFTTTGATILSDFAAYDRAFFLWRAMTQWFGGLGVIALFVVVLPRLGIAGRQIFFAEASAAAGDAVSPQVRESARRLWILYTALTAIQALLLIFAAKMPVYDGIVHSLTTLSAGGFSPNPQSIAGYANPTAEWIFIFFMVLSGTSFTLQYRAFTRSPIAFLRDGEFVTYFVTMLLLALGASMLLVGGTPTVESIRSAAFQVTSLASSTGYASADFEFWTPGTKTILILAMVIGGCAGSACGGPKVIRYILATKYLRREITQVLHPRAVIPIRYRGSPIPAEVIRSVVTLVFLYVIGYAATGAAVTILEEDVDLVTGFSAALACFGNIGPGLGRVGPMLSYAEFSGATKTLLALSMWVGRLEIVTVIALLHPDVWRNIRWHATPRTPRL